MMEEEKIAAQLCGGVEEKLTELKKTLAETLADYEEELARERRQADLYRSKVQAEDVIKAMLPELTDIYNDILDIDSLETMKQVLVSRFERLAIALSAVGVDLKLSDRGTLFESGKLEISDYVPTGEKDKERTVAKSVRMGCVIKNPHPYEISEEVTVYRFDETLVKTEEPSDTELSDADEVGQNTEEAAPVSEAVTEVKPTPAPHIVLNNGVFFLSDDIYLKSETGVKVTLFEKGNYLRDKMEKWSPRADGKKISAREFELYIGTELLDKAYVYGKKFKLECRFEESSGKVYLYIRDTVSGDERIREMRAEIKA